MKGAKQKIICILGTLLFATILFDCLGFWYSRKIGLAVRFIPLTEEEILEEQKEIPAEILKKGAFYETLQAEGLTDLRGKDCVVKTLQFVMNSVIKVEASPITTPDYLYRLVTEEKQGCLCSGMAHLFQRALILQGIPARRVSLKRNFPQKVS